MRPRTDHKLEETIYKKQAKIIIALVLVRPLTVDLTKIQNRYFPLQTG